MSWDGTKWAPDTANGWDAGKQLHYPDGAGDPDAEGVTLVGNDPANGIFVATERNNSVAPSAGRRSCASTCRPRRRR